MRAVDLIGCGVPDLLARNTGYTVASITAAGTTVADATVVKKAQTMILMTATGSDGISLPSDAELMRPYIVSNTSGSTGKVYGSSGCNFTGGSTDAAISITTLKSAAFFRISATQWLNLSSA